MYAFLFQELNKDGFAITDKRISANGGKGPPAMQILNVVAPNGHGKSKRQKRQPEGLYAGNASGSVIPHSENQHRVPHTTHENKVPLPLSTIDKANTAVKVPEEQQLYVDGADDNNNVNNEVVNDGQTDKITQARAGSVLTQNYIPRCDVSAKEVASAIRRAKTIQCKQEISDVYCLQQEGKLYTLDLPNFCPNKGKLRTLSFCWDTRNAQHFEMCTRGAFYDSSMPGL